MARSIGERGEAIAAEYLERRGWSVVERGFRFGRKEIDLVACRDGVVSFVEVKTRSGSSCGHPLEAITERKRADILEAAQQWICERGEAGQCYRFDAIAIFLPRHGPGTVEHVPEAWGI